jgi:hypothetical protein
MTRRCRPPARGRRRPCRRGACVRRPAQSVASGAMRIPPASIQLASQLPDLVENLVTATEHLNNAVNRTERYIALAERMLRTMDALLPQVEALVVTGNELYNAVSSVPGVSTLGRLTTRSSSPPPRKKPFERSHHATGILIAPLQSGWRPTQYIAVTILLKPTRRSTLSPCI